jgi:Domain of unknown function (DUF4350)
VKHSTTTTFALAITLSALAILSGAYYWPVQDAYHPLNYGWNGCSAIAETPNSTLILSYHEKLPEKPLLAIIGPTLPFSTLDGAVVRNYLENNGTVLLADNFGSGNSLLKELNVSARFAGKPLADIYAYSKNPRFPFVSDFLPNAITFNVTVVMLDHPSFLEVDNSTDLTTFAFSSPFSFIDEHDTGQLAQNVSIRAYPVMALTHVGNGSLILISDPDMFINDVIGLFDNMRVFENLVNSTGGAPMFDVAHLANAPMTSLRLTVKDAISKLGPFVLSNTYVQIALVTLLVGIGLPLQLLRRFRRKRQE